MDKVIHTLSTYPVIEKSRKLKLYTKLSTLSTVCYRQKSIVKNQKKETFVLCSISKKILFHWQGLYVIINLH